MVTDRLRWAVVSLASVPPNARQQQAKAYLRWPAGLAMTRLPCLLQYRHAAARLWLLYFPRFLEAVVIPSAFSCC